MRYEHLIIYNVIGLPSVLYNGPGLPDDSPLWKELCTKDEPYKTLHLSVGGDELYVSTSYSHRHMDDSTISKGYLNVSVPLDEKVIEFLAETLKTFSENS